MQSRRPRNGRVDPSAYESGVKSGTSVFKARPFKPPKCYLDTEKEVVTWVAQGLEDWERVSTDFEEKKRGKHYKTKHKSLDTSIMEIADDIAYGVHDGDVEAMGQLCAVRRSHLESASD